MRTIANISIEAIGQAAYEAGYRLPIVSKSVL